MSLRLRLSLWVAAVSLVTQVLVLLVSFQSVRATAVAGVQAEMLRSVRQRAQALRRGGQEPTGGPYFLLSPAGALLLPPADEFREELSAAMDQGLVRPGQEGLAVLEGPHPTWFALQPLGLQGPTMGLVEGEQQVLQDLDLVREEILEVGVVGTAALLVLVWLVTGGITLPLLNLAAAARRVARGDLDTPVPPVPGRDEIAQLASSFGQMQEDLRQYVRDLERATAQNQRMESEMAIGGQIQQAFLPLVPEGREVSAMEGRVALAATFRPARIMAGDLYDFFPLSPTRLAIAIGDVAGKGLPAAMLMVVTHTLLRAKGRLGAGPADCLARVNRLLCEENRASLFVTLQLLVLDLEAGTLTFANAGHHGPVLLAAEGTARVLEPPEGIVLGVDPEATYEEYQAAMAPGETLVLYTDGLSEAMGPGREQFGDPRVVQAAGALGSRPVQGVVAGILEAMDAFTRGLPPRDDLTVLALRRLA